MKRGGNTIMEKLTQIFPIIPQQDHCNLKIQFAIVNKSGVPLYYHSSESLHNDYLWLSSFVSAVQYLAKTVEDQVTEIIADNVRYLFHENDKFIAILALEIAADTIVGRKFLDCLAHCFEIKYGESLDELGRYSGRLNHFESFTDDFNKYMTGIRPLLCEFSSN